MSEIAAETVPVNDDKQALIRKVLAYNPQADADLLSRAYDFAKESHKTQMRASGEPYFLHPLEVAFILADLKLDTASIVTGLLHDTVEDTTATTQEIKAKFGDEIASLVDGVTKLSKLEEKSDELRQAENFRKLIVALSEDIRVLLVKLADRLHNMRTISHIQKPEKRKRIAHETLEIYSTLAERIGMRQFKEELQDLAFEELHGEARVSIVNRLGFLRSEGQVMVEKILAELRETLKEAGLNATITGREKKPYSIWKKMESKNISFEQLSDIMAFRIVVNDIGECYRALGAVHSKYHTVPGRFKDYISTPKPNGYKSIHTSVIGPANQRVEIQIRDHDMHKFAEYGVAAHWSYKQGIEPARMEGSQFRWIRELLEILEQTADPEDVLENARMEMYHDQVFCFTPKGDLIAMPRNSTPVDFAYAVHSAVGHTCVGAKVNGRIVPLRYQLQNGDQVDIIRSKTQTPSPAWERFVVTAKAKAEVRKFIRTEQRQEYITLGRAILTKFFRQEDLEFQDKLIEPVLKVIDRKSVDDVLAEVGEGILNRSQVLDAVFPGHKEKAKNKDGLLARIRKKEKSSSNAIPIHGLIPGMAVHYAGCCHPIPGDRIVGIVVTGRGVTIHTMDCETLENFSDQPERWIDVSWDVENIEQRYVGRLRATVAHESGALAVISNTIAQEAGNISNLKITNRSPDFFEILLDIEVDDIKHLNGIMASLRSKPVVQSVDRFVN